MSVKRLLHILLAPVRLAGFVVGILACAVIEGADQAEDWYTDGQGLGKIINDQEQPWQTISGNADRRTTI